jgi:hypothetical protein
VALAFLTYLAHRGKDALADDTAIYSSVQPPDAYRPQISYAVNGGAISDIPAPNDATIKKIALGISEHIEYRTLTCASWTFAGRLHTDIFVPRVAMPMASEWSWPTRSITQ